MLASGPAQARLVIRFSDLRRSRSLSTVRVGVPGQTLITLVSGAIALGTFRTRLETRTKESSMCASHWDYRILKAE